LGISGKKKERKDLSLLGEEGAEKKGGAGVVEKKKKMSLDREKG